MMQGSEHAAKPKILIAANRPYGSSENFLLVACAETRLAAAIDPGADGRRLIDAAADMDVAIDKIILTNGHLSAACEARALADHLGIAIEGPHEREGELMATLDKEGKRWEVNATPLGSDRWVVEGDMVTIGALSFDVYETPGTTIGAVSYHNRAMNMVLTGSLLTKGGIGRIDIPGGDGPQLVTSVTTKLWPLGRKTTLFPAYGDPTTIGEERLNNPYISDAKLADWPGVTLPP